MKTTRRSALILLLVAFLLLVGAIFRTFLDENLIKPLALVFWMIRRVFMTVDQGTYWNLLLILVVLFAVLLMANHKTAGTHIEPLQPDLNSTLNNIDYWRTSLGLAAGNRHSTPFLQKSLAEMLALLYTTRQTEATRWETLEALRQGSIPLPGSIHAFLFPPTPRPGRRPLRQALQDLSRHWSGRDAEGYFHSVEEVLDYMESMMEIKHDRQ
jgi:hypothetical protein